jgi:hypothetical protein
MSSVSVTIGRRSGDEDEPELHRKSDERLGREWLSDLELLCHDWQRAAAAKRAAGLDT